MLYHYHQGQLFENTKTIRDKLLRSKLKEFVCKDAGTNICGHSNCDICKIFESGDQFESKVTKKKYRINFAFDCKLLHSLFTDM